MSKALICDGDKITTGGRVFARLSTMFDGDRRIALDREMATCGRCPGEYPIHGTGADMEEDGRATVLDGDLVLCPCGINHVSAGGTGCQVGE